MLDINQTYERPELSQLAVRYKNRRYIASDLFPWVDVPVDRISWPKFDRAAYFKPPTTAYGARASANELEVKVIKTPHDLKHRGLGAWIDDDERRIASGIMDVRAAKLDTLMNGMMLDLEIYLANIVFNASTYPTANKTTLVGTAQWSDGTNSDPQKAVFDASAGMIMAPNTMVVGALVDNALKIHPKVKDAVKYTSGGLEVTDAQMARFFNVDRYIVGRAKKDTAAEGQTESLSDVWGKFAALLCVNYNQPTGLSMLSVPSFAYMPISRQEGSPWRVYTEAPRPSMGVGSGMEYIKVDATFEPLVCASDLGYLFSAAIA